MTDTEWKVPGIERKYPPEVSGILEVSGNHRKKCMYFCFFEGLGIFYYAFKKSRACL